MLTTHVQSWLRGSRGCHWSILFVTLCLVMPGGTRWATADEKSAIEAVEFFGGKVHQRENGNYLIFLPAGDVTDAHLLPQLVEIPNLEVIGTSGRCEFDPRELSFLVAHQAKLKELFLGHTPTNDAALSSISVLTGLELLQLGDTEVSGAGLVHLAPLQKLKYLGFHNLNAGDECIEHLAKLQGLKDLEILGTHRITREGKRRLAAALPACSIAFGATDSGDDELWRRRGESVLQAVQAIRAVGTLGDDGTEVDRIQIRSRNLAEKGELARLAEFSKVKIVTLTGCQFKPRELRHLLPSKENIRQLSLNDTPTDDEALKYVGKLEKLQMLGLSRTHISNAGMAHLVGLTNLKYLTLGGTAVGDDAIEHLAKLKSLKKLAIVGDTKFTDDGQKKLKLALPDCAVEFRPAPR